MGGLIESGLTIERASEQQLQLETEKCFFGGILFREENFHSLMISSHDSNFNSEPRRPLIWLLDQWHLNNNRQRQQIALQQNTRSRMEMRIFKIWDSTRYENLEHKHEPLISKVGPIFSMLNAQWQHAEQSACKSHVDNSDACSNPKPHEPLNKLFSR